MLLLQLRGSLTPPQVGKGAAALHPLPGRPARLTLGPLPLGSSAPARGCVAGLGGANSNSLSWASYSTVLGCSIPFLPSWPSKHCLQHSGAQSGQPVLRCKEILRDLMVPTVVEAAESLTVPDGKARS